MSRQIKALFLIGVEKSTFGEITPDNIAPVRGVLKRCNETSDGFPIIDGEWHSYTMENVDEWSEKIRQELEHLSAGMPEVVFNVVAKCKTLSSDSDYFKVIFVYRLYAGKAVIVDRRKSEKAEDVGPVIFSVRTQFDFLRGDITCCLEQPHSSPSVAPPVPEVPSICVRRAGEGLFVGTDQSFVIRQITDDPGVYVLGIARTKGNVKVFDPSLTEEESYAATNLRLIPSAITDSELEGLTKFGVEVGE